MNSWTISGIFFGPFVFRYLFCPPQISFTGWVTAKRSPGPAAWSLTWSLESWGLVLAGPMEVEGFRGKHTLKLTGNTGFALSSLETSLNNWEKPEKSPRVSSPGNLWGWFYHVTRCLWLMVDPGVTTPENRLKKRNKFPKQHFFMERAVSLRECRVYGYLFQNTWTKGDENHFFFQ